MDVDLREHLDLDLPGYEFLWNCAICLKPAICGVGLQFQWLEFFILMFILILTIAPGLDFIDASIHFILIVFPTFQQS